MAMMLFLVVCICLFISTTNGFRLSGQNSRFLKKFAPIRLSDNATPETKTPKSTELVPIDKTSTANAAAVTGGILGFILAGPFGGIALAAISNYVAKKENESGEALRGFGKVVVEAYNYVTSLNSKYKLTDKATETVTGIIDSAASDNETLVKVKTSYTSAVGKLDQINKEFDLVTKGKEVVVAAATLSDAVIDKAVELNDKVRIT
jgi:hypothetical protein